MCKGGERFERSVAGSTEGRWTRFLGVCSHVRMPRRQAANEHPARGSRWHLGAQSGRYVRSTIHYALGDHVVG